MHASDDVSQPTARAHSTLCCPRTHTQQPPSRVVVADTTRAYREAARAFVGPDDAVLEVGCSYGGREVWEGRGCRRSGGRQRRGSRRRGRERRQETTRGTRCPHDFARATTQTQTHRQKGITTSALHARAAFAVGVDKSAATVAEARRRHPGVRFEAADGFDLEALRRLSPRYGQAAAAAAAAKTAPTASDAAPTAPLAAAADRAAAAGGAQAPPSPAEEEQQPPQQQPPQQQPPRTRRQLRDARRRRRRRGAPPGPRAPPLFTRVFLDIGGVEELRTVMALAGLYFHAFPGAALVIKSRYLKTFLSRASLWGAPGGGGGGGDHGGGGGGGANSSGEDGESGSGGESDGGSSEGEGG